MKKSKRDKDNPKHSYQMPVELVFGWGSSQSLVESSLVKKSKKILLVAGRHFDREILEGLISRFKEKLTVYEGLIEKSDLETVDKLTIFCREIKPELIIGIGGGTALDTAKAAAILSINSGSVKEYVVEKKRKISLPGIPLIALPTTAGTGAEVTPFAVIWDSKNQKKYSLASPLMFPRMAVVDPRLTESLPREVTACSGIDALSQAIEAYWSKNHNPVSDVLALKAIRLVLANLEQSVKNPNRKSREVMALASLLAGMAFSNTKTTICHSVSYPITAHWGVPHGHAVALTLPSFLKHSLPVLGKRQALILNALGVSDSQEAAQKITDLMGKIGLATKLSDLGIKEKDLKLIVEEGFDPDRAVHAPWVPTPEELKTILRKIL